MTEPVRIQIEGVRCEGCVGSLRAALEGVPGVEAAEVGRDGRAEVRVSREIEAQELDRAVRGAGDYRIGSEAGAPEVGGDSLWPLVVVVVAILVVVLLIAWLREGSTWSSGMRHFMAGFFLVFGAFKLPDLRGFVAAYRAYDLVARAVPLWAWVYPFVEIGLGVAYALDVAPRTVNVITLIVMLVGAAGVLRALLRGQRLQCACLGTWLRLPMTKVTLIEDLSMALMAGVMLVMSV